MRITPRLTLLSIGLLTPIVSPVAAQSTTPTIDAIISLKRVGSPEISPDGKWVAYTVRETNWEQNSYDTSIWLADVRTGAARQLTRGRKSSTNPTWAPDGQRLAFASDRTDRRQLYVVDVRGGEAEQLTTGEDSPGAFAWAPDGKSLAVLYADARSDDDKAREARLGEFDVIDAGYRMTHLWVLDVATHARRRITGGAYTVGRFSWSPDGKQIAFDHRINGANANGGSADISVVEVATGTVRPLVTQAGPDANPIWSPDGSRIAFESQLASPSYFFTNAHVAVVPATGGAITDLSAAFDENPGLIKWVGSTIYFSASAKTSSYLFGLDPQTRKTTRFAVTDAWAGSAFTLSSDASMAAFVASDPVTFPEVYAAPLATMKPVKLSDVGAVTAGWRTGALEVISWKSKDGAVIEGVLHKPVGFVPGKRYPLLVVIHGGPTGTSRPVPYSSATTYPIDLWTAKGALVLEPNYRGSAGYGEKFRSLNVRNLGVGDAWDVLSGVDHLIQTGLADSARVGAMGWSQGGYISMFLTTHDAARFKAISAGAGISDWMTYYVNTDITPFTRQYLKATPWDDPAIYAKTSPMTYIKGAKTPTLIQHGATDQRVPLPNAFELYRGLQDVGVPSTLIVYRGFEGIGHGPSRPKSSRALMEHNLAWFGKYIWGEADPKF
ncbi:MAG: S9 family peptidase [Gemmatimonadaceae bacterium]|nr:S9 family peptidase [Gemmatimonadaceae bacterium]